MHRFRFRPARTILAAAMAALLGSAGLTVPALAMENQVTISPGAYGGTRGMSIELNKSVLVDLPAGVAEVIVSRPEVAAAIMRTRTRAVLQGMTSGDTNIFFLDDAGRTIQVLDLRVIEQPSQVGSALQDALRRVIPNSNIRVESVTLNGATNRVVLSGTVKSAEDRDRAIAVAGQFAGGPENVASILDVSGAQQVMLQVTVSEIRRDVARELGINLSGTVKLGSVNLGFNSAQTSVANGISGSFPMGDLQLNAALRALEDRGALRLLAQPTLTAMSGEEASFLVGGQFPIPTTDSNGVTTVTYKDYGVQLKFTPVLRSNGQVALTVDTGVSEVQSGSYALTRRDVKTSVELAPGSTLAIGGLLDERMSRSMNQVPGLGEIPILGALFRSTAYQTQQTEMVVLVTPYIVNPSPAGTVAVPTDYGTIANDAEAMFLGAMEKRYGVGAGGGEMRGSFSGQVGFVLD